MSEFKTKAFNDRAEAAAKAKQAMLAKFRARDPNDPEAVARREAAAASAAQREAKRAEAAELRKLRLEEEEIERKAALVRAAADAEIERIAEIERQEILEAEAKARRDLRYAARKARQG